MKIITLAILLLLLSFIGNASSLNKSAIIKIVQEQNIIYRDSGKPVTKQFLENCLKNKTQFHFQIDCTDILFKHDISIFKRNDESQIILITENGASVENRWLFLLEKDKYKNIKNELWPNITSEIISKLLIQTTGDTKYTKQYINGVAHSMYRTSYLNQTSISILSGIPNDSFGKKIGSIIWTGKSFNILEE